MWQVIRGLNVLPGKKIFSRQKQMCSRQKSLFARQNQIFAKQKKYFLGSENEGKVPSFGLIKIKKVLNRGLTC
jgi:hypothetical protein